MELSYSSWRYFSYIFLIYSFGAGIILIALRLLIQYKNKLKELESEKRDFNKILCHYTFNVESLINRDKKKYPRKNKN